MTVIFQHIPKAAGSSLLSVFRRQYEPSRTYHMRGPGGVREAAFARLPSERLEQLRLVTGHLYFGIHNHLSGPFTYVTMLRHPVDRVISHYHYVRRSPHHYLYDRVVSEDMSLEKYVSSELSLELNNGQVRSIFGPEHQSVPYGECSGHMLRHARRHLREHYSVVGVTGRFDESLLLMSKKLGWTRSPFYVRKNVSRARIEVPNVPRHVLRTIERDNALDLELYDEVCKLFEDEIGRSDILERRLRHFRLLNGLYCHFVRMKHTALGMVVSEGPESVS